MEPKPKERIVFDEDLYYGDEGEEMAINDLMERDGLTEGEVREDFTDDEIFNHQMEIEGDDLAKVNDFLKKSCMEFSGSLPGDEKDEDGYSLTGEAKDATASRNGLSRNQMGIEEKAAECKEAATVLANGNAL